MKALALMVVLLSIMIADAPLFEIQQSGTNIKPDQPGGCCGTGCRCTENGKPCTCNHTIPRPGCTASSQNTAGGYAVQTLFSRIKRYVVSGYHRLTQKTILDQEKRQQIYAYIQYHPGIDLKTLIELSGCNENTLRYHLWQMENVRKIKIISEAGCNHYYENHGKYTDEEQKSLAIRFSFIKSEIFTRISHSPGLTRGELAEELGISGPSVTKTMKRFIEKGLMIQKKDGKCTRYYLLSQDVKTESGLYICI